MATARGVWLTSTLIFGLVSAMPAWAQTAPATPAPAAQTSGASASSASADTPVVTIFGHRQTLKSDQLKFAFDPTQASSCNFSVGIDRYSGGAMRSTTGAGDASQDGPPADGPGMGLNAPNVALGAFGNGVTNPIAQNITGSGPCDGADRNFARGRADIARLDTSMKEARAAYEAKDYAKALPLFKKAYDKLGPVDAADALGQMYLRGQGTPRDTAQAIVWLKKAAESPFTPGKDEQPFDPQNPDLMNGLTEAAMTLANIYRIGWDVPADPKQARHWYAKADEFGYIPATYALGAADEAQYGGEGTLTSALKHLLKAGTAGYAPAQYELGVIYYSGGDGVPQDKDRAGAWLVLAAKQGHADALYACGRMYDLGEGGASVDPGRALIYYKEAAEKGQPDAEEAIGKSFYLGQGVDKHLPTARYWFDKAAMAGQPDAMFELAVMLANGEGGPADPVKAYAWMRLAQKNGVDKAGPAAAELAGKLTPDDKAKADAALAPPDGAHH